MSSRRGRRAVARVTPVDTASSSSGNNDELVVRLSEVMTNALRNLAPAMAPVPTVLPEPRRGPSRLINADVLPDFDPSDINQSIEDWCIKIDEISVMYGWSEDIIIFNALSKLKGLAATWYKGLKSVQYTWVDWKQKLIRAFPSQRDFHDIFEEMMKRKKRRDETFAQYFYEKQALINACELNERQAVSCIIGGILDANVRIGAKAAHCQDPESLFDYLRTLNEDVHQPSTSSGYGMRRPVSNAHYVDKKRRYERNHSGPVCINCKKPGHSMRFCRFGKGNDVPNANNVSDRKCFLCQEVGHYATVCPKRRKTTHETK